MEGGGGHWGGGGRSPGSGASRNCWTIQARSKSTARSSPRRQAHCTVWSCIPAPCFSPRAPGRALLRGAASAEGGAEGRGRGWGCRGWPRRGGHAGGPGGRGGGCSHFFHGDHPWAPRRPPPAPARPQPRALPGQRRRAQEERGERERGGRDGGGGDGRRGRPPRPGGAPARGARPAAPLRPAPPRSALPRCPAGRPPPAPREGGRYSRPRAPAPPRREPTTRPRPAGAPFLAHARVARRAERTDGAGSLGARRSRSGTRIWWSGC